MRRRAKGRWRKRLFALSLLPAIFLGLPAVFGGPQAGPPALGPPRSADALTVRLWAVYGAILVARGGATPPPGVVFAHEAAVAEWQASVPTERATIGKVTIELQTPALRALARARDELRRHRLEITPRTRTAARRSYADTVRFWQARVHAGLRHWESKGRITREEARRIRALAPAAQLAEILRLEEARLFFSGDFSKSILYSAAPPGASQHLSMLALDLKEHGLRTVRTVLARHGWFQTVPFDLPHFAYLGCKEKELPALGLKKVARGSRVFWVPDLSTTPVAAR